MRNLAVAQHAAQGCYSEMAIKEPVITHTHFSPPSIWGAVIKLTPISTSHWWQRIKKTWGKSAYPAPSDYIHKPVLHQTRDGTQFACLTFILHRQLVNSTHILKCSVNSRTRWSEGGISSALAMRLRIWRQRTLGCRERGLRTDRIMLTPVAWSFAQQPQKTAVHTGRCIGFLY